MVLPRVVSGGSGRHALIVPVNLCGAGLYVSVKTVEFHLGHIFDKLGIRSRQELITPASGALSPTRTTT
jgi:hypothetical protein